VINALLLAVSEEQLRSNLRGDLPLVILGSIITAIGVAAVVLYLARWQSGERVLLWFGLFAGPYGLLLLINTTLFQMAFGEPEGVWPFVNKLVELATLVPALLLFEDFYGKGWRSSVRWLIRAYVLFATIAFTAIVIQRRPNLVPTAGIGAVFLLPAILLLGRLMGYSRPHVQDQGVLSVGLLALFLTFAHDRIASTRLFNWHADTEPYGLFVLICCLGYAATRRVLANERLLVSMGEEMRAATRIQSSILPRTSPETESFKLAVRYAPMTAVAGDFYDFLVIRPGCLGIVVADVTGHGVPAALVASMVKVAVSAHTDVGAEPGKVIAGLNSTLCRQAQGQYASAVYVFLDQARRMGCYSAAGHPPLLLWHRATRTLLELNENGLLLGVRPGEEYPQTEFTLEAGDRLLVYTDGLVEAVNARGEAFGEAHLGEFIATHQDLPAEQFAERLLDKVLGWPENGGARAQADDITVVVIDIGNMPEQTSLPPRII
jgi:sigma-B regulation protein RsbU (phosphoserine phosphatase)